MPIKLVSLKAKDKKNQWLYSLHKSLNPQDKISYKAYHQMIYSEVYLGKQKVLLAIQDEQPVGCLVARTSFDPKVGLLSFFDCLEDRTIATQLFDMAINFFLENTHAEKVIGPMKSAAFEEYRFSIGPYQEPVFLFEPSHPSFYPELFENYGFGCERDYYSRRLNQLSESLNKLEPKYIQCLEEGFYIKRIHTWPKNSIFKKLFALSRTLRQDDPYYFHIGFDEFYHLEKHYLTIIKQGLSYFIYDNHGVAIGFIIAGIERSYLNIYAIIVHPEFQKRGLASTMLYQAFKQALKRNVSKANILLIREGQKIENIDFSNAHVFRRYRLYGYNLNQME